MKSRSKLYITYAAKDCYAVKLTGNTESTGNWDPSRALLMTQDETSFRISIEVPLNTSFEYKYLKFHDSSEETEWEAFSNRKLKCAHSIILINDSDCSPVSKIFFQSGSQKQHYHDKLPVMKDNIKFTINDSIIFVNFNLPLKVTRNPDYSDDNTRPKWLIDSNKGIWLPFLYDLTVDKNINIWWVGWPGIVLESEEEKKSLSEFLALNYKCYPVFLTENEVTNFQFFCNRVLYPVFCNIIHTSSMKVPQYSLENWEMYKSVNSIFSEVIMNNYSDQIIWINDYSLMLTPNFVSRRIHELLNIGFYLQSPFPSTEVFKLLPQAESILHSILACDLVSFHSYDYASEFLKTCKQIIGIEHHFSKEGCLLIEYYGRHIMVRVGDIGTENEKIESTLQKNEFLQLRKELDHKYHGHKVVLGIDTLTELSGIYLKIKAFSKYLKKSNGSHVLVQYLTSTKIYSEEESRTLKGKIVDLADKVNLKYGRTAVDIVFQDLSACERYALMSVAYALINTSLRDSMCLVPYEFLIVSQGKYKPIIVSENAGVSRSLRSFIKVNPFSKSNITEALDNMPNTYKHQECRSYDTAWLQRNTMQKWAISFLNDLKKAQKNPKLMQYMKHGMGDKMKLVALRKNFSKLDVEALLATYKRAHYRAMFFDNEGTLVEHLKGDSMDNLTCTPKGKLLDCLKDLCQDPQNVVFVITGREKKVLDSIYNIPHLGLAAEFGAFIKWNQSDWESRIVVNELWKDTAKHIIQSYVVRTEGSYLEEKENSIVFQYKNCDVEYGSWQAKELVSQLDMLLSLYVDECEIVEGTGYVEVKPRDINKGYTVEYLLDQCYKAGIVFDFVLIIGDDSSDEEMFKVLKDMVVTKHNALRDTARCFSCTLGRKPTEADYYLNDSSEILQYLEALRHWTKRDSETFANWNTSMHIVDIVKSARPILDMEAEENI